jgi:hypothetical protein
MQPFNRLTSQHQKWSLFCVLMGALGFTVSMNPAHFNQPLARNEVRFQTMDLAQTAEPAKPVARPPGEEKKIETREVDLLVNKKAYKATVFMIDNTAYAKFKQSEAGQTEAQSCDLCRLSPQPISSSLDKLEDLRLELAALARGALASGQVAAGSASPVTPASKPQKPGEATEVDIEKWAEKCVKESSDSRDQEALKDRMDCHKHRLIELSKFLKNSSETERLLATYFEKYLAKDLQRGLSSRSITEHTGSMQSIFMCPDDKSMIYSYRPMMNSSQMRFGCFSESARLEAEELTEDIIKDLRASNGRSVIKRLIEMRADAFRSQLAFAEKLRLEVGKQEGGLGSAKVQYAMAALNPMILQTNKDRTVENLDLAISAIQTSFEQSESLKGLLEQRYSQPVQNLITQISNNRSSGQQPIIQDPSLQPSDTWDAPRGHTGNYGPGGNSRPGSRTRGENLNPIGNGSVMQPNGMMRSQSNFNSNPMFRQQQPFMGQQQPFMMNQQRPMTTGIRAFNPGPAATYNQYNPTMPNFNQTLGPAPSPTAFPQNRGSMAR